MEEIRKKASVRLEHLPDQVVGYYEPGADSEIVGILTRPLPGESGAECLRGETAQKGKASRRIKRKTGLWIFLGCLGVILAVTAAALLIPREEPGDGSAGADGGSGGDSYDYVLPGGGEKFTGVKIPEVAAGSTRLAITEAHGEALTPQEVYAAVNPAVVTVMVDIVGGGGSVGTGVIFTEDGYMLTNYHVVEGGYNCVVATWDNAQYPAWYVAGDRSNDIAILKIEGENLPSAEIGDSTDLAVGDVVYAIGSPLGTELRGTFTDGIVSALDRDVDVDGRTMILLQTNTALNSGNSGGPLINQYGQVVGINTIKMMSDYSTVEGLGFAIPSERVRKLGNELLTQGYVSPEPLLGITVEQLGTRLPDGTVGARIVSISEGSAAAAAGLQAEDIIVSAGGLEIRGSGDVLRARNYFSVGDRMPMRVWRNGAYLDVELLLMQAAE